MDKEGDYVERLPGSYDVLMPWSSLRQNEVSLANSPRHCRYLAVALLTALLTLATLLATLSTLLSALLTLTAAGFLLTALTARSLLATLLTATLIFFTFVCHDSFSCV